jgi:hypothetical protein
MNERLSRVDRIARDLRHEEAVVDRIERDALG